MVMDPSTRAVWKAPHVPDGHLDRHRRPAAAAPASRGPQPHNLQAFSPTLMSASNP